MKIAVPFFVLLVACSSGSTGSSGGSSSNPKCQSIAKEIDDAAIKRGYDGDKNGQPDSIGVCTDTSATIKKDFGPACDRLQACESGG